MKNRVLVLFILFTHISWAQIPKRATINNSPISVTVPLNANMLFAAFHDQTAQQHQKQFNDPNGLLKQGYRLTSLSVYRNSGNLEVKYASVWTKSNNTVAWAACHGLTAQEYQAYFAQKITEGYHPTVITATGGNAVGNNMTNTAIFGAVFEKGNVPFQARHNINFNQFNEMCTWAKANGYYLRWATIYGGRERLYAGIWEQSGTQWDYKIFSPIDSRIPIPMTMGNLKINFLTHNPFGEFLTVYTNNNYDIRECHDLDSGGYQNAFNNFVSSKYIPVVVQVSGDSRQTILDTNYTGLFRKY